MIFPALCCRVVSHASLSVTVRKLQVYQKEIWGLLVNRNVKGLQGCRERKREVVGEEFRNQTFLLLQLWRKRASDSLYVWLINSKFETNQSGPNKNEKGFLSLSPIFFSLKNHITFNSSFLLTFHSFIFFLISYSSSCLSKTASFIVFRFYIFLFFSLLFFS